jgi:hypothetical protein
MRAAAERKGMPQWQSSTIMRMADMVEMTQVTLTPIKLGLDELWNRVMEWLSAHRQAIIQSIMALILLTLLIAAWLLMREARVGIWLRSRYDYLRLGLLRQHAKGNVGVFQYYAALQNLMDVNGMARPPSTNTREYLAQIGYRFEHLRRGAIEMTFFFERARYGNQEVSSKDLERMHQNYRRIYKDIERLM